MRNKHKSIPIARSLCSAFPTEIFAPCLSMILYSLLLLVAPLELDSLLTFLSWALVCVDVALQTLHFDAKILDWRQPAAGIVWSGSRRCIWIDVLVYTRSPGNHYYRGVSRCGSLPTSAH